MIGTFRPTGPLHRGRYIGTNKNLEGVTALVSDEGEFWAVQADWIPDLMFGWWKFPKKDWEIDLTT